jgi:heme exporter protein D
MVNAVYCDVAHPNGTWSKLMNMETYPSFYDFSLYAVTLLSSMMVCGVLVMKKSKEMDDYCLVSEQKSSEKLD